MPGCRIAVYPTLFRRSAADGVFAGSLVDVYGVIDVRSDLDGIAVHLMGDARTQASGIDSADIGDLVLYIVLRLFADGLQCPQLLFGGGFENIGDVVIEFVDEWHYSSSNPPPRSL